MNAMDVALICKALGDANRLEIVQMLSDGEKLPGYKLLERFEITQPTLSHDEFSGNIVANSYLNCCICLKIKKYLMSLPHLPISAFFHQDIILHIQAVHQWQVRLMHSLIRVWFLNPFQLPNSQCGAYSQQWYKHQCCSLWIVFCKYCSHRILSPYRSINHLLQKSEAFQSVHHVTFILCYTVL